MWSKQKSPRFAAEKTSNPVGGSQGDHGGTSHKHPFPMAPMDSKNGKTLEKSVDFSVCFLDAKENWKKNILSNTHTHLYIFFFALFLWWLIF